VMKNLTENHFTTIGTSQFFEHTRLMTETVGETMRDANPTITRSAMVSEAVVKMTMSGFGAVGVVDDGGKLIGVFSDGDLRRLLEKDEDLMKHDLSTVEFNTPVTLGPDALLFEASSVITDKKVDTISIVRDGKQGGMLDIQDLV